MTYKLINGWKKAEVISRITSRLPSRGPCEHDEETGCCAYFRPSDGARCAVGAFVPKGRIQQLTNYTKPVADLLEDYPEMVSVMPLELEGLEQLQKLHDNAAANANIKNILINWVKKHVNHNARNSRTLPSTLKK